jgi:hypothetical protein
MYIHTGLLKTNKDTLSIRSVLKIPVNKEFNIYCRELNKAMTLYVLHFKNTTITILWYSASYDLTSQYVSRQRSLLHLAQDITELYWGMKTTAAGHQYSSHLDNSTYILTYWWDSKDQTIHTFNKRIISLSLSLSLWLYSSCEPWTLFQFLNLHIDERTSWRGDQPVANPLPTHRSPQTQNKRTQTKT